MAQYLKRRQSLPVLCISAGLLLTAAAQAQMLSDPTRPQLAPSGAASGAAAPPVGSAVLQSIMVSDSSTEAIISGTTVHAGERYGAAEVVRIADTEVVLRTAEGLQTLKLFPGIEKRYMDVPVTTPSSGQKHLKSK